MGFFELILSIFPIIKTILLAIIPLGFLIFIHELGHFIAAKRSGIKVNTFSIGFGPKIVGIQRGETLYKISWLPFGGYVQMEGENPNEQTGAEGEFGTASLGKRAYVVIAGPVVNLLFGILAYWFVFGVGLNADAVRLINGLTGQSIGIEQDGAKLGWLDDNGPAAIGGILPGDTVVSINGDRITNFFAFRTKIYTSPNKELELVVQRDGNLKTFNVTPISVKEVRTDRGQINVLEHNDVIIENLKQGSLAEQNGLREGDQILTINGQNIYDVPYFGPGIWNTDSKDSNWVSTIHQELYNSIELNGEAVELGILRDEQTFNIQLPVQWQMIVGVEKKSAAHKAGIKTGDILATFNGKTVDSRSLFAELKDVEDNTVTLGLIRNGEVKTVTISPTDITKPDEEGTFYGLSWYNSLSGMILNREEIPTQYYSFFSAIGRGLESTWLTCTSITRTLKQLIGGEVSPKYLSGPVGIAEATSRIFSSVSLTAVLFFIGFISINLAIVNLLPIPIADGGHLLFFAIEKIRGRPLPRKAQEIIQQVSVVLLIALFLYITWFDSLSLFNGLRN